MDISRKTVVPWGNWGAEKAVSVNNKNASGVWVELRTSTDGFDRIEVRQGMLSHSTPFQGCFLTMIWTPPFESRENEYRGSLLKIFIKWEESKNQRKLNWWYDLDSSERRNRIAVDGARCRMRRFHDVEGVRPSRLGNPWGSWVFIAGTPSGVSILEAKRKISYGRSPLENFSWHRLINKTGSRTHKDPQLEGSNSRFCLPVTGPKEQLPFPV